MHVEPTTLQNKNVASVTQYKSLKNKFENKIPQNRTPMSLFKCFKGCLNNSTTHMNKIPTASYDHQSQINLYQVCPYLTPSHPGGQRTPLCPIPALIINNGDIRYVSYSIYYWPAGCRGSRRGVWCRVCPGRACLRPGHERVNWEKIIPVKTATRGLLKRILTYSTAHNK